MLEPNPMDVFGEVVAESGTMTDFERGDLIFSEGDPARSLDFLLRGAVRLWHPRDGEEPLVVGVVRGGQLIEPGPFFLAEPHETSASAVTPCRLIRTDRKVLEELIESQPELRVPMLELLRDATEQSVRIARFLRTAHRIPETSGAVGGDDPELPNLKYSPSRRQVTLNTSADHRPK